ncbi:MAG: hypothetical protein ACOYOO_03560 [Saprospiraceae bacterium]
MVFQSDSRSNRFGCISRLGVVQKVFAACGGSIYFLETRHFRDFASRNRENDVSLKTAFGAKRRKNLFTQPHYILGLCKRFLPPAAAEYAFETDVFFMILLRKIMKNTSVSNLNLARSAVKKTFYTASKENLGPPHCPAYSADLVGYGAQSKHKHIKSGLYRYINIIPLCYCYVEESTKNVLLSFQYLHE